LIVAIGFEPVAVRIDDEGRVIVGAIVLAKPGLSIVAASRAQRRFVEGLDTFLRGGGETDMQPGRSVGRNGPLSRIHPQGYGAVSVAERGPALAQAFVTERLQDRVIETLGMGNIADADGNMVEHGFLPVSEVPCYAGDVLNRLGKIAILKP